MTIYPPVAQALFLGVTRVGETVVVMNVGLVLFEALTVAALIALLKRFAMPPARVAAYAWGTDGTERGHHAVAKKLVHDAAVGSHHRDNACMKTSTTLAVFLAAGIPESVFQ